MEPTTFDKTAEGVFLDECIRVLKAINARTAVLLAEYEAFLKAVKQAQADAQKSVDIGR